MNEAIETTGKAIEVLGVLVIAVGTFVVLSLLARALLSPARRAGAYREGRERLGRVILLGLELLVAGDIIRTVAVAPTFRSIGVLAGIVLIRTFLSVSLEMEITGHWPWRREEALNRSSLRARGIEPDIGGGARTRGYGVGEVTEGVQGGFGDGQDKVEE